MRVACVLATSVLASACTDAASSDPALAAVLQVEGAQWRPGAFPADEGGPAGIQVTARNTGIVIDHADGSGRGVFGEGARAAVIAIAGYDGAWLVPTGVPDLDTEGLPVARFAFAVTGAIEPGPFTLVMAGADADGRFGAPASALLVAEEEAPPAGELVIGLVWSGPADLDLHVVDALGGEAWSDKPNTMIPPPPGTPIDPNSMEHLLHGQLDHDGNRGCTQHAHPNEHMIWQMPPQAGDYVVRVDTRSLCGAPSAVWYVAAYRSGELIGAARGTATPADVLLDADTTGTGRAGAGVLALRFTL